MPPMAVPPLRGVGLHVPSWRSFLIVLDKRGVELDVEVPVFEMLVQVLDAVVKSMASVASGAVRGSNTVVFRPPWITFPAMEKRR